MKIARKRSDGEVVALMGRMQSGVAIRSRKFESRAREGQKNLKAAQEGAEIQYMSKRNPLYSSLQLIPTYRSIGFRFM
jgi:hypothetical protein